MTLSVLRFSHPIYSHIQDQSSLFECFLTRFRTRPWISIAGLARRSRCITVGLPVTAWLRASFDYGYLSTCAQCGCDGTCHQDCSHEAIAPVPEGKGAMISALFVSFLRFRSIQKAPNAMLSAVTADPSVGVTRYHQSRIN